MKKSLVIICICLISSLGCEKNWTEKEKKLFIEDCKENKGTEQECICILNCLELEYNNYNTVLKKVPVSIITERSKQCLKQCKN